MIIKFLRHRRYKKMIRVSASFILNEFALIVDETIEHFEANGIVRNAVYKEALKLESMVLVLWLFQEADVFSDPWHKLILDEVHNQYFEGFRKHGYTFEMRKKITDHINMRYSAYNETVESGNLSGIGTDFARILAEKSKVDLSANDILVPMYIIERTTSKFEDFRVIIGVRLKDCVIDTI